jgi:RNA polymerase sigma factor (sigma-70 family)
MVAETTFRIESWPQTIPEFNRLVAATQDELVHFASYRLGNREDAEDVVQDIYVQAFRDREKRRDITDVRPYLFRMTGNRCTDFLRARSRWPKEEVVDVAGSDDLFDSLAEAQIPMMELVPPVGMMAVVSTPMVVVFPAPLGPRRPKISPRDTSKETPSTALVLDLVYLLTRLETAIAGVTYAARSVLR